MKAIDSEAILKRYFICWKIIGQTTGGNPILCGFYDIMLSIFITIFYPAHLIIGLFDRSNTQANIFKNLAINLTSSSSSIKHFFYRRKLVEMQAVGSIFSQLDKRIHHQEERDYFTLKLRRDAHRIINLFLLVIVAAIFSSFYGVIISAERRLLYPGWLPFDWRRSEFNYICALCYQCIGIALQIMQNYANDVYAPLTMCMLAGHVQILSMRLRRVGYEERNPKELVNCINDWQHIIKIYNILQDSISRSMFAQFVMSGLNICVVIIYLLFYAREPFDLIYYTVYLTAIVMEIFSCCVYASIIDDELHEFPYAIFSCNWMEQDRCFRKNVFVFSAMSMRDVKLTAGGMIRINLATFLETCKLAYSLFALVMNVR